MGKNTNHNSNDGKGHNQTNKEAYTEVDLVGFDQLWNVDYEETQRFVRLRQSVGQNKDKTEIDLLSKELEDKSFEVQKLNWQISEREKELKRLYDEVHKLIELNKKLNKQLNDFENLSTKHEALIEMLSADSETKLDPILPNF